MLFRKLEEYIKAGAFNKQDSDNAKQILEFLRELPKHIEKDNLFFDEKSGDQILIEISNMGSNVDKNKAQKQLILTLDYGLRFLKERQYKEPNFMHIDIILEAGRNKNENELSIELRGDNWLFDPPPFIGCTKGNFTLDEIIKKEKSDITAIAVTGLSRNQNYNISYLNSTFDSLMKKVQEKYECRYMDKNAELDNHKYGYYRWEDDDISYKFYKTN